MSDFPLQLQDWVCRRTAKTSVADASLHFMKQPLEIVQGVRDNYWAGLWQQDVGFIGEEEGQHPMPSNPDWSKIIIEFDGE